MKPSLGSWLRTAWGWLNQTSGAVQALTTIVLAVLASMSWTEVREQRQLVHEQMRLANLPFLIIRPPLKIDSVDNRLAATNWNFANKGGNAQMWGSE